MAWVTKVMVFEKPAEGEPQPLAPTAAAADVAPNAAPTHEEAEPAVEVVTPDATVLPGDAL